MNRQRKVAILEELLERIQGQVAFEDLERDDAEPEDELRLEGDDVSSPPRLVTILAAEPAADPDAEDATMAAIRAARAFARDDGGHESARPDGPLDTATDGSDSGALVASTAFDPAHEEARRALAAQVGHALEGGDSWGTIGFASEAPSHGPIPAPPRVPSVDVGGAREGALARALAGAAEKRAIDSVPPSWREVADGLKPRPSSKPSLPPLAEADDPSLGEATAMLATDEIDDRTLVPGGDAVAGESLSPTEHAPVSSRGPRLQRPRGRPRHVSGNHLARRRQNKRRSVGAFVVLGLFAFLVVALVVRAARTPDETSGRAAANAPTGAAGPGARAAFPDTARTPTTASPPHPAASPTGAVATQPAAAPVRTETPEASDPPVPAEKIARDAGRLLVRRGKGAEVYVNGVPAGATGSWIVVPCGLKHLRLAESATPAAGKSFPAWLTGGAPLVVPCRGAAAVDAPPDLDAAELERLRERDERG